LQELRDLRDLYAGVGELVRRAAGGDQASWEALVERFAPMVWAVARGYRLSPADAADVSQTTWMRLVQHLHSIEQPERVGGWLATTARREALRTLRVANRQVLTVDDEVSTIPDPIASADQQLLADERDVVLWEMFSQLPPRCQSILSSITGENPMSYEDLGALLDMPIGSIGPTRARCLERLRRLAAAKGIAVAAER
jgi:RNA polymerase sigma factor (sigma-70 family)